MGPVDELDRDQLWLGGCYELFIRLGASDDLRLTAAIEALWIASGLEGRFVCTAGDAHRATDTPVQEVFAGSQVCGHVVLPDGRRVPSATFASRTKDDLDWIDFFLPLGGLAVDDERIGGFPFGDDGGAESLTWRAPLDAWLASLAAAVFQVVPFDHALIGFEVTGDELETADEATFVGSVLPDRAGGTTYRPATR